MRTRAKGGMIPLEKECNFKQLTLQHDKLIYKQSRNACAIRFGETPDARIRARRQLLTTSSSVFPERDKTKIRGCALSLIWRN